MYKLGLVSISFRNIDVEAIIKYAKDAGLSCIEWGSDVHAPNDDVKKLDKIVELQNRYGIKCCSYGTYFRLGKNDITQLQSYIDAAKALGTDILRLWCGDKNSEDYTSEEKTALFEECKAAADIAKKNGVVLCMECHNNTYTNTKEAAFELMHAVNSEHFRMYWQPNQFRSEAENTEYAKLISPYTENIHVFNWKGDEKFPLCEAKEVWRKYLTCFKSNKTLLLEFMPDGKIESLKKEAATLKEIAE